MYTVKEIFFSLQGEGAHSGQPAVFCRFSGCNLWNGKEEDRHFAVCSFCDTDFLGVNEDGGKFSSVTQLTDAIDRMWPLDCDGKYLIFTGGEPLLQLDHELVQACKERGFFTAIETNGTLSCPGNLDWICVSPKSTNNLIQSRGNELKLVFPQPSCPPEKFQHLEFQHFFLQPMDGANLEANTQLAIEYCESNPQWKLSIQTQKIVGIR